MTYDKLESISSSMKSFESLNVDLGSQAKELDESIKLLAYVQAASFLPPFLMTSLLEDAPIIEAQKSKLPPCHGMSWVKTSINAKRNLQAVTLIQNKTSTSQQEWQNQKAC